MSARLARLAVAALLVGLAAPPATAQTEPGRYTALAAATVVHQGVTKLVWLQAEQQAAGAIAASGGLIMMQLDATRIFGDFSMIGSVACMKVIGARALIGLNVSWGLGTAPQGSIFYITVEQGPAGTFFDNGGFEGPGTPDGNTAIGAPGGGATVVAGHLTLFESP